ncbi:hypothetical protein ZWY2020_048904 [Hordeum vulgare]|nr:hypothetical protein ZWY2020_048904 [Hordeum vulgare]
MSFNCAYVSHFQPECEAPPRCGSTLAFLGYGILVEGGFYFVDATLEDRPVTLHLATITPVSVQEPPPSVMVTPEVIWAELCAYIGDYSGRSLSWEVSEIAPLVFSVSFPSRDMLNVCTYDLVKCSINKLPISIK